MTAMFDDLMNGLDEVESFLGGKSAGYKVSIPSDVDVKSIRKRLHMTQAKFANTFGFSVDAVKHWEGGRRTPEASARAFLTVIARDPKAVIRALYPGKNNSPDLNQRSIIEATARNAARAAAEAVAESVQRSFDRALAVQKRMLNTAAGHQGATKKHA